MTDYGDDVAEHGRHLPADQIIQRQRIAFVRHVRDVYARGAFEYFHREMSGRA